MKILLAGASGATGKLLLEQLLNRNHEIRAIVRTPENLPGHLQKHKGITLIKASILDLSDEALIEHVKDCDAVASCLGHNLTFKGLYGQPRKLVRDAAMRLCKAIEDSSPEKPVRYVLMNTTGNRNRDLEEPISTGQRMVIGLIRLLLPPHADNEQAADFLRTGIGQNSKTIEWSAVRPDDLIDEAAVSEYEIHPSPIRSAIFNAGKTSRINVAHFMAELITDDHTWNHWKGQMPVIYNKEADG